MSNELLTYDEIVKSVQLETIKMSSGDDLFFKIEIIKKASGMFSANLWRTENYRIQPTFPQENGKPASDTADEEIIVKDNDTLSSINANDADTALEQALILMTNKFKT